MRNYRLDDMPGPEGDDVVQLRATVNQLCRLCIHMSGAFDEDAPEWAEHALRVAGLTPWKDALAVPFDVGAPGWWEAVEAELFSGKATFTDADAGIGAGE